ncbi:hypothetical protein P5V15_006960 [Pogonomyrmex californicus]
MKPVIVETDIFRKSATNEISSRKSWEVFSYCNLSHLYMAYCVSMYKNIKSLDPATLPFCRSYAANLHMMIHLSLRSLFRRNDISEQSHVRLTDIRNHLLNYYLITV